MEAGIFDFTLRFLDIHLRRDIVPGCSIVSYNHVTLDSLPLLQYPLLQKIIRHMAT